MDKYVGNFSSWDDVCEEFGPNYHTKLEYPEPADLIIAEYSFEGYEGDANVLWRNEDGTFGYVKGSHCSCYGLENQWSVEELTKEMIEHIIESNEKWDWSFWNKYADVVKEAINKE